MEQLKRVIVGLAVCLTAGTLSALPEVNPQKAWRPVANGTPQKVIAAKPRILDGKTIVCGNKKLLLSNTGKIVLANAANKIATIYP
ncbi:MAG: hypothetical protein IKD29_09010, partial [Lentisphaeria bacterium]|nr:hypothetical protein [Lentisphaeria bacterium]